MIENNKLLQVIKDNFLLPVQAIRLRYLPLLMIYFAYGASTFSGIAESFYVKEHLNLTAEALLMISVWVSLPWTIKMVFGQFADSLPLFGNARKSYIFIAAALMAIQSLCMAAIAGDWHYITNIGSKETLYFASSVIGIIGVVLQDVVADAMSVEVVEREGRSEEDIKSELAMVQLLGRLFLMGAIFLVSGLGGWLADIYSYQTIFLMTLIIPVISITGVLLVKLDKQIFKPVNKQVLYSGLVFAVWVVSMGFADVTYAQEIILIVSLSVVIFLLSRVIKEVDQDVLKAIICAAIVIFVFRVTPGVGPAAQWWQIDVLGFDKSFFGVLNQIGSGLAIAGLWFGARLITQKPIGLILVVLTLVNTMLAFPLIGMYYGLHEWTMEYFGFGARTIALVDTAIASPFAQLSMVPMLALIAIHAPKGNAATWFALMASFMNLALTAGTLLSKLFNQIWVVTREVKDAAGQIISTADYSELGTLLWITTCLGFVLPMGAVLLLLRKDLGLKK